MDNTRKFHQFCDEDSADDNQDPPNLNQNIFHTIIHNDGYAVAGSSHFEQDIIWSDTHATENFSDTLKHDFFEIEKKSCNEQSTTDIVGSMFESTTENEKKISNISNSNDINISEYIIQPPSSYDGSNYDSLLSLVDNEEFKTNSPSIRFSSSNLVISSNESSVKKTFKSNKRTLRTLEYSIRRKLFKFIPFWNKPFPKNTFFKKTPNLRMLTILRLSKSFTSLCPELILTSIPSKEYNIKLQVSIILFRKYGCEKPFGSKHIYKTIYKLKSLYKKYTSLCPKTISHKHLNTSAAVLTQNEGLVRSELPLRSSKNHRDPCDSPNHVNLQKAQEFQGILNVSSNNDEFKLNNLRKNMLKYIIFFNDSSRLDNFFKKTCNLPLLTIFKLMKSSMSLNPELKLACIPSKEYNIKLQASFILTKKYGCEKPWGNVNILRVFRYLKTFALSQDEFRIANNSEAILHQHVTSTNILTSLESQSASKDNLGEIQVCYPRIRKKLKESKQVNSCEDSKSMKDSLSKNLSEINRLGSTETSEMSCLGFQEEEEQTKNVQNLVESSTIDSDEPVIAKMTADEPVLDKKAADESLIEKKVADEPIIEEAAAEPVVEKTAAEPAIEKTAVKPVIEKTAAKPVIEKTAAKPEIEKTAAKPVIEKAADKPIIEKKRVDRCQIVKKTASVRLIEKKTADGRQIEKKTADGCLVEKKTADRRLIEKKTADRRLIEKKTADRRLIEKKTADRCLIEKKTADRRLIEKKTSDERLIEKKTADRRLIEKKTADRRLIEKKATDRRLIEKKTADVHLLEKKTVSVKIPTSVNKDKHIQKEKEDSGKTLNSSENLLPCRRSLRQPKFNSKLFGHNDEFIYPMLPSKARLGSTVNENPCKQNLKRKATNSEVASSTAEPKKKIKSQGSETKKQLSNIGEKNHDKYKLPEVVDSDQIRNGNLSKRKSTETTLQSSPANKKKRMTYNKKRKGKTKNKIKDLPTETILISSEESSDSVIEISNNEESQNTDSMSLQCSTPLPPQPCFQILVDTSLLRGEQLENKVGEREGVSGDTAPECTLYIDDSFFTDNDSSLSQDACENTKEFPEDQEDSDLNNSTENSMSNTPHSSTAKIVKTVSKPVKKAISRKRKSSKLSKSDINYDEIVPYEEGKESSNSNKRLKVNSPVRDNPVFEWTRVLVEVDVHKTSEQ